MLTIFSDLHLTDGTASVNVNPEAFTSILGPQIIASAGSNNADEINIVMLGDIFDLVRSDYWLSGTVPFSEKPWGGIIDKMTGMNSHHMVEDHYKKVLEKIIETEASGGLISMLNEVRNASSVPVKVTYVTGNHDRAINNFDSLKEIITSKLPGFNPRDITFTNSFKDERYTAMCRHGHEYDENNFGYELYKELNGGRQISRFDERVYRVQSIGEAITAELMAGVIFRMKGELGENDNFVRVIMNINNVRPMSKAILWMHWLGKNRKTVKKTYLQVLLGAFKESLVSLLETPLAKVWDNIKTDFLFTGDITDKLSKLSSLIKLADLDDLQGLIDIFGFFDKLFGGKSDALENGAKEELSGRFNKNIQYQFMGHTHEAKQTCFSGDTENFMKLYVNTGTYLPLIQQTMNKEGFSSVHQMTMAFVYNTDEDYDKTKGRPNKFPTLDLWNGIKKKEY